MSVSNAQLHFAAEFAVFLVTLGGLALTFRSEVLAGRPTVRSSFAAGFLAEAAAAFLYGSLILSQFDETGLVVLRLVGLALLLGGCLAWRAPAAPRVLLLLGVVALLAGEATRFGLTEQWSAVLRIAGALLLGAAVVFAARRSIPARIGTSAAALLLVVILAVSLALSIVINRNVVNTAFSRLDSRARSYATGASAQLGDDLALRARLVGAALSDPSDSATRSELVAATSSTAATQRAAGVALSTSLAVLGRADVGVFDANTESVLLVVGNHTPVASAGVALRPTEQLELAGSQTVTAVLSSTTKTTQALQSVAVAGKQVFALAAYPVAVAAAGAGQPPARAVAVVATHMDSGVLQKLVQGDTDTSVALVVPGLDQPAAVYMAPGVRRVAPASVLQRAGHDLFTQGAFPRATSGGAFVVGHVLTNLDGSPIQLDHTAVAAVVVSSPTTSVDHTREDLFRTLFLVALGGALLALALSISVGERLGSGLRRLASAAGRISTGDLEARTELSSPDELGALSASFDSMAGSLATMTDDLRRAADEEAALRARLQAVVAGMGDALVAVDPNGRITDFNPAAEALFGMRAPAALGRRAAEVITVAEEAGFDPIRDADAHGGGEQTVLGPAGESVPVSVSVGRLDAADGELAGAVVVLRDMRREHEVEDMKTQFLANISHELRTPLTPIKGYAGVLARRKVSRQQAVQYAGEIQTGVDQLERVITQLVDFASMAAGRLSLRVEPVPARGLLSEVAERWRGRLPASCALSTRVARDAPAALVDAGYLQRCFDELIDNAVKYSPAGGRISLAAYPNPAPEGAEQAAGVRLTVTDQGIGLAPDTFERLLDDFSQADASATRRFGGLGLGLTLVDRVVRAHHGVFSCEVAPGGGARFVIVLPGAQDAIAPEAPPPTGAPGDASADPAQTSQEGDSAQVGHDH